MPHAGEPVARNYVIATFGKGSLEGLLQVRILERKKATDFVSNLEPKQLYKAVGPKSMGSFRLHQGSSRNTSTRPGS